MTTDRKLLGLAAKAAGARWTDYPDRTPNHWEVLHPDGVWRSWAPLTDDGDALRLAVKLGISIHLYHCSSPAVQLISACKGLGTSADEDACDDNYAATRRAIVRAAADLQQTDLNT